MDIGEKLGVCKHHAERRWFGDEDMAIDFLGNASQIVFLLQSVSSVFVLDDERLETPVNRKPEPIRAYRPANGKLSCRRAFANARLPPDDENLAACDMAIADQHSIIIRLEGAKLRRLKEVYERQAGRFGFIARCACIVPIQCKAVLHFNTSGLK